MRETAARMWTQIRDWLSAMPRGRKIQMAVLSVVVVVLSIVVVTLLTRTVWIALPGTGDPTTTSHIYTWLVENGYPANPEGGRIMVPEDRLSEIQMVLRDQGFLGTSVFDDSILQDAVGFGVTDRHAGVVYARQRAAEIRTQVMQSDRVTNALAIVNFGERSPFRTQLSTSQATASVMLTLRGGGRLTRSEAQTIADIVRTAIPGIEYENITIADQDFFTYKIGEDDMDIHEVFAQREVLEKRLTNDLQESVYQLLTPVFGLSNIRVQPHVRLNFDRVAIEEIEFFPPIPGETEGIVRSSERLREMSRRDTDAMGIPGTDSNNMGSIEYPYGTLDDGEVYRRGIDQFNYEINQTITQIQRQEGVIEYLSIAVNINSEIENVGEDFTAEVTDLVSKAIGTSSNNISVKMLPFIFEDTTLQDMYTEMEAFERAERNRAMFNTILNAVVIVVLGLMVMMLGRTIVRAVKPPPEPEPVLAALGPEGIDLYVDDEDSDDIKEYEDVDLQPKSAGLEQIERFIDKDSASVAQLLRNWLSDE